MTYRWLDDLDLALAAGGVPYELVGPSSLDPTGAQSWSTRGRPYSTGQFDPSGVLCHHTASPAGTSDQADINGILCGNSQAPGPVSQLYLGRSGVLYLVAAGRCNHGGQGIRPGIDSGCADMNAATIGIEAGNSGVGEPWPPAQTAMYAATVAALCSWYGWGVDRVWLHATTGPPYGGCNSKIDPAGPWELQPDLIGSTTWDLDLWRATVTAAATPPTPPEEDEMTDADWARMQGLIHETVLGIVRSNEFNTYVTQDAQVGAHEATLGVVRSEEYANIIRSNTA
jgi:hypothetical protein